MLVVDVAATAAVVDTLHSTLRQRGTLFTLTRSCFIRHSDVSLYTSFPFLIRWFSLPKIIKLDNWKDSRDGFER